MSGDTSEAKSKMQYVRMGDSGLKISRVVIGCLSFGDTDWQPWLLPKDKALPILKYAYDKGINTFDVADTYSNGESERILGAFLKEYKIPRNKVVIMTKCYNYVNLEGGYVDPSMLETNDGTQVNQVGLTRKHIFDAIDASIERLGTYPDILQVHRCDRNVTPEETMRALNDVVDSGKARYIGASSMPAWMFQRYQTTAEKHGWHRFISMQGLYSLLYREEEREMIPYCKATGVGYIPWSPLAAGMLAHPWDDRTDVREQSDVFLKLLFRGDGSSEPDKRIVNAVEQLSKEKGFSMAQIAAAWVMSKGAMPIMGLESPERIDQAIEALEVNLSEEDIKKLEESYQPKPPMPF